MNKEFVPYEQARELKQLGFNEPCFAWFILEGDGAKSTLVLEKCPKQDIGLCLAPVYSQAFRFFREKHDLNCYIDRGGAKGVYHAFVGDSEHGFLYGNNGNSPSEFTYEEAQLACLNKLIEIVK